MNTMTYQGYTARIDFDDRDNLFVGRLLGIRDVIAFHADSVAELRAAFEEAVTDYLETCAAIGKKPEKPASGKLLLRVSPELHAAALVKAQSVGKSLNQWATEALSREVSL
ncbi:MULTISPECIES: type II toxin-antitoxin system HicB family antitoxin [Methylomonas]|uniref:type II toxin-antitoxin system HicB family antitoxin n=1 Tax=Methylomonas TaxID=416 RepID=UPI001232B7B4|nr:type II toxin-antitoxin system HicB family antitoxin [Methylomonas rhizoryzae]